MRWIGALQVSFDENKEKLKYSYRNFRKFRQATFKSCIRSIFPGVRMPANAVGQFRTKGLIKPNVLSWSFQPSSQRCSHQRVATTLRITLDFDQQHGSQADG